jgi:hypothetical protein
MNTATCAMWGRSGRTDERRAREDGFEITVPRIMAVLCWLRPDGPEGRLGRWCGYTYDYNP